MTSMLRMGQSPSSEDLMPGVSEVPLHPQRTKGIMSISLGGGPAGIPLARMVAAYFARPQASGDVGARMRRMASVTSARSASEGSRFEGLLHGDQRGTPLNITSVQNAKVKLMRSFHRRRTRDQEGKALLEGHRLVCDLIEGGHSPDLVIVSPEALNTPSGPRLEAALETLPSDVVAVAPAEVVQRCCDTMTAQGVVALVDRPKIPLPPTLRTVLVCDSIQDPGNLGTLVRSAAGLGADAVVLTGTCVDYWSPKTLRSSMGAAFRLASLRLETWDEVVELVRANNMRMYAAEAAAPLVHFDVDWTSPSALVVGGEARGLGVEARRGVENGEVTGISIPLVDGVESLNAAVAGAIVLGESQRQRALAARQEGAGGDTIVARRAISQGVSFSQ